MIPKKIHYCWFGKKDLPELALKCIASWKKYCPDYEIIEWNEDNFDINACRYIKEAYEAKKWAFVSDYARFKIIFENGGIYFDTDVELISQIDDIIEKGAFMACELDDRKTINPGLGVAAEPGNHLYKEILDGYNARSFIQGDGKCDLKTIVEYTTETFQKHGLSPKNEIQEIEGISIYPKEFFNPYNFETGEIECSKNTRSIHHYAGSWTTSRNRINKKIYQTFNMIFKKIKKMFCYNKKGEN